jgi:hypothetical protein
VRLSRQVSADRLQPSGCSNEQPTGITGASLLNRNLATQEIQTGVLQFVEWQRVNYDQ